MSTKIHAPDHLNRTGCRIGITEGKGRGVYAVQQIPVRTVIEISPVLLFAKDEYAQHGKHTVLDHYTFNWPDGRMALALGLGSLFNHSDNPNVSFSLDTETESIRYTTSRIVSPGEELCIFYGHKLWFDPVDAKPSLAYSDEPEDGWGGLSGVLDDDNLAKAEETWDLLEGDPNDIIPEEKLPFVRSKIAPDDNEEEELDAVKLQDVWVVDISDQRHISILLKWLRQSGLEDPSLSHLKRIRKQDGVATLLLAYTSSCPSALELPEELSCSSPYTTKVPRYAALTQNSLQLKSTLWPTIYAPRKKYEPEPWSRGKVRWAWEAMRIVVREAKRVKSDGELPIIAYVPEPYDDEMRRVAEYRANPVPENDTDSRTPLPIPTPPICVASDETLSGQETPRNGSHYLLTGLTLFMTHEPCIMCSMALLHSRVKEIFYLIPMKKTGGCGGAACIPRLQGVNHRYGISSWNIGGGGIDTDRLEISEGLNA
ncbi:hypothetical protein ABKN59_006080 [Abortiporus biennis]